MLDAAYMGLHVGQMTGVEQMKAAFDAVTTNAAKVMQLDDYGLKVGANADIVICEATSSVEALQLRPERLYVIRRGNVIASTTPRVTQLHLAGSDSDVSFSKGLF